jgi:acetyl esterase
MTTAFADHLQFLAVTRLARLPDRARVWLSGKPPIVVDGQTLDPQLQLLAALRAKRNRRPLAELTPEQGRARLRREILAFRGPLTPVGAAREVEIQGASGPLRARHYAPPDAPKDAPLLVYFHGGGYVTGDLETHEEPCRLLCRHAVTHVLSVDYRLAPEHPFPAGLEDAHAAFRWAQAHAEELGAHPNRVSVGGDSAGANLSAVTAQRCRRERPPAAQLLIYPPTDAATSRPSHELFSDGPFLSNSDVEFYLRNYTDGTEATPRDPRLSPLLAGDLSGLPPALVIMAGFDVLRDEGQAYADALAAARTPVQSLNYAGLAHGFINITGICPAARRAMLEIAQEWNKLAEAN